MKSTTPRSEPSLESKQLKILKSIPRDFSEYGSQETQNDIERKYLSEEGVPDNEKPMTYNKIWDRLQSDQGATFCGELADMRCRSRSSSVHDKSQSVLFVAEPTVSVVIPLQKKVTFEGLPEDDDEKENKRRLLYC
ncbi:uncharacterized protein PV07_08812 [Cladophialophora immunda]|uniref:Uncharacterized protein n=1 Tax=Cladophialophora immunda TaxID=569365 RepID=A0A0D1ZD17_9EURO|nr:uncharacterized protein PV07_08812 [Cladophialophora immunda]KIW25646.1 hypothetical protein PV07_08812 [Cladophialophora immunda]